MSRRLEKKISTMSSVLFRIKSENSGTKIEADTEKSIPKQSPSPSSLLYSSPLSVGPHPLSRYDATNPFYLLYLYRLSPALSPTSIGEHAPSFELPTRYGTETKTTF